VLCEHQNFDLNDALLHLYAAAMLEGGLDNIIHFLTTSKEVGLTSHDSDGEQFSLNIFLT